MKRDKGTRPLSGRVDAEELSRGRDEIRVRGTKSGRSRDDLGARGMIEMRVRHNKIRAKECTWILERLYR